MPTKAQRRWTEKTALDFPVAVPSLAEAAQLLGRPLAEVQDAAQGILVYRHQDRRPMYSIYQLAKALGLVESRTSRRRRGAANRPAA
jgi:hypothetical protein